MNLRHSRIDAALPAVLRVLACQRVTRCVKDSAAGKHPAVKPSATSMRENTICLNGSRSNRVSTSCLKFLKVAQFAHERTTRHASIHRAQCVFADDCADDCHALNYSIVADKIANEHQPFLPSALRIINTAKIRAMLKQAVFMLPHFPSYACSALTAIT